MAKRKLSVEIIGEARDARRAFDSAGDAAERFDRRLENVGKSMARRFSGFAKLVTKAMKPLAVAAAGAFSTQFLAQLGAGMTAAAETLVAALGGALALLPSLALGGVVAFGSLRVAVLGVADALEAGLTGDTEAFAEALEKLSPAAQAVVGEIVDLRDELDELRSTVQEAFFAPLIGGAEALAQRFLPAVSTALAGVAGDFGGLTADTGRFLRLPDVAGSLKTALGDVRTALGNLIDGFDELVRSALRLVPVGAEFLPQLTGGFETLTRKVEAFVTEAIRTGAVADLISDGVAAIKRMIDTAKQVGRIFRNLGDIATEVFDAIGGAIGSGGLLDGFEDLTEATKRWVSSAEGSETLSTIFETIGSVLSGLKDTISRVFGVLADFIEPLIPDLQDLAAAASDFKTAGLDVAIAILTPLLAALGTILRVVVLPAITAVLNFLADHKAVLIGVATAISALLVPAFIAWAVNAGIAAANTILAWLSLLGPLGLVLAAVAAAVALIITFFDEIKAAVAFVFNWIKDHWKLLLGIITGPIGAAVLLVISHFDKIKRFVSGVWEAIKDGVSAAGRFISDTFGDVVDFFRGLPGKIADLASGMWDGITDAFKDAINGIIRLWNGLSFPELTVGGGDPLGSFGPSLPSVTIGGWDLPNIPLLAEGGIVTRPTLAFMGEAGPEAVVPLGGSGGFPIDVRVFIEGDDTGIMELIRHRVRVEAGGNVQEALGR